MEITHPIKKKIGNTGGIYATKTGNTDEALQMMEKSKAAGTGGDFPENDVEALIYAQKNYPEAKALVLIADNMASVRDIKLLEKLAESQKPVHILIARTEDIDLIVQNIGILPYKRKEQFIRYNKIFLLKKPSTQKTFR